MNPAGRHVCHSGPCPYTAPIPDDEASHITQIGSVIDGSIGFSIGVLHARAFIDSKHLSCMGRHSNRCPFLVIACKGPVNAETSGIKCAISSADPLEVLVHYPAGWRQSEHCRASGAFANPGDANCHSFHLLEEWAPRIVLFEAFSAFRYFWKATRSLSGVSWGPPGSPIIITRKRPQV